MELLGSQVILVQSEKSYILLAGLPVGPYGAGKRSLLFVFIFIGVSGSQGSLLLGVAIMARPL